MMAAFLDENLPDGTRLRPGTKFIKYWKMRNTGTVSWNADTKVNKDGPQDTVFNTVLTAIMMMGTQEIQLCNKRVKNLMLYEFMPM